MVYKIEPLEDDEIIDLRKACKTFEEELIINVLLETGLRVSEFDNLTEEEIQILKTEGYKQTNEYCVVEKKNVPVFVKPILNHSKTHTFLA